MAWTLSSIGWNIFWARPNLIWVGLERKLRNSSQQIQPGSYYVPGTSLKIYDSGSLKFYYCTGIKHIGDYFNVKGNGITVKNILLGHTQEGHYTQSKGLKKGS